MMSENQWQRDPDWIGAILDDSLVMLHVESGRYVGLNKTATAIWDALAQPVTPSAIQALLVARFSVPADQCAAAIERSLAQFERMGAIRAVA